ncbi:hypothetical protein P0C22_11400 [Plesiomonas shigelloides]|uniref:hypothetical protein n=1 Tax=Plesiomonas shigelloides TaxID=703 RepID=UPI000D57141F|nr:hypothetical protein [Plesiomonas shigelloides]PVU65110.1 hypothetical protein C9E85_14560 [Plesiomonas shigelloides]
MTIYFLQGLSQYNALNIFSDELEKGFKKNGYKTEKIDLLKNTLTNISEKDVIITFNHIGMADNLLKIINEKGIKVISLFVDHPYYHQERLKIKIKNISIGFVCKSHLESIELLNCKIDCDYFFFPHGGIKNILSIPNTTEWNKRKNNLLFIGSLHSSNFKEINKMPESLPKKILTRIENLYIEKNIPFDEALKTAISELTINLNNKQVELIYNSAASKLFAKKRYLARIDTIKTLSKNNKIDIYGPKTWAEFIIKNKLNNVTYCGEASLDKTSKIMQNYKFVINDINFFSHGSHERNLNIICAGSIPITYRNEYTDFLFEKSLPEINEFDKINIKASYDIINKLFKIAEKHTWEIKSKTLIERLI